MKRVHAASAILQVVLFAGTPFTVWAGGALFREGDAESKPGGADAESSVPRSKGPRADPSSLGIAPAIAPLAPVAPVITKPEEKGVDWAGLFRTSGRFLLVEHGFRLLTEPGTRAGLRGSFLANYARAASNLNGWADGDEFYVNYVGHPMQGAVAGYIWAQHDRAYRRTVFSRDPQYWKSRLRAAAFMWAYSTQFEIGPVSEASLGGIQSSFPQQGFVDQVITPSVGMAWMIGEDALDRALIERMEGWTTNPWANMLIRSGLNPARSFANVLGGRVPWYRDSRPGVFGSNAYSRTFASYAQSPAPFSTGTEDEGDGQLAPPFEFSMTVQPEWFVGGDKPTSCLGGGATAGFRLAPSWQLIADVSGCNLLGLENNVSGDSLTYLVGPRWLTRIRGGWSAHLQVLAGGNKLTAERMNPLRKQLLQTEAVRAGTAAPAHADYTEQTQSHGFAVAGGGGVNYSLNRALTIRVADLSYRRSWAAPLWGRDYSDSVKLSAGLVLHMGTW